MATDAPVFTLGSVLITGAEGHIARGLLGALTGHGNTVWSTTRRHENVGFRCLYLDLADESDTWSLPSGSIDVAFLCAAIGSQDRCGMEPEFTHRVNVAHMVELARRLVERGAFVVFISTNLVFDGNTPFAKIDHPYNPSSAYGKQKVEAEQRLLAFGDRASVVRLGKVIVPGMPLIADWIETLRAHRTIRPFNNLVMAPVSLDFAVDVLCRVAVARHSGIVHATAARDITYAHAAEIVARRIGMHEPSIAPVSGEFSPYVAVPRHAALESTSLDAVGLSAPMPERAFDCLTTADAQTSGTD